MDNELLIFSNTTNDADLRYLLGMHIPDDLAVVYDGQRLIVLASALEINRIHNVKNVTDVISWDDVKSRITIDRPSDLDIILQFLKDINISHLNVKPTCPVWLADGLRKNGISIDVNEQYILPERIIKTEYEICEIRRATNIVKDVFQHIENILSNASINVNNELIYCGDVLTSDRLRSEIENLCYQLGAIGSDTIVACGKDACDPHQIGHGPIKSNEFIVIDFFPYLRNTGYYADVTRTFFKGTPSNEHIKLYTAVKDAHDMAIQQACNGVKVIDIMHKVLSLFDSRGYKTDKLSRPPYGMFHSLGHGIGLNIHEPPRLGLCDDVLQTNMVVTVEPGLYYHDIGGVRIEDDVLITDNGCDVVSHIPYNWIIK